MKSKTRVKNTFKKSYRPYYAVLIPVALVVAYFDAHAYRMFQKLENPGPVYQVIVSDYMTLFHGLVFTGLAGMSMIVWYYQSFRDGLAFFVMSLAVIWSGLWDLVYYQFGFTPSMPTELSHLADTPVGTAAYLFNGGVVSPEMVVLNTVLFLGVGLPVAGYIRYGDRLDFLDRVPDVL